MPWQQQQQVQLQPLCTQGLNATTNGMHSPLGTSCDSSDSMDPAVFELEQFMLQELAAAGVLAPESSSATRLPQPPAAVAAVAAPAHMQAPMQQQQQLNWQPPQMPQQQQQQQQQQRVPVAMPAPLQHQCSGVYPHAQQQQQQQWYSQLPAAPGVASQQRPAAAVNAAMPVVECNAAAPAGVAGMMQPVQYSCAMPASSCAAAAASAAAAAAPVAAPVTSTAGQSGRNAHVMAQLQDRLFALQAQMEDMQLMLGLLQNC
jgi:hypothetical protein